MCCELSMLKNASIMYKGLSTDQCNAEITKREIT